MKMKLFKYNQFLGDKPLNENLDKAKKFLKDTYLLTQAATNLGFVEGELKAQLDHKEKRSLVLGDFTPEQEDRLNTAMSEIAKLVDEWSKQNANDKSGIKINDCDKSSSIILKMAKNFPKFSLSHQDSQVLLYNLCIFL